MAEMAVGRKTLVGGMLVVLVIGLLLGFILDKGAISPSGESPRSPHTAGPADEVKGVLVGYPQTEQGAVAAATNFALVGTSDLIRDKEAYVAAAQTMAADSWRSQAEEKARNGHEFALEQYGSDIEMSSAILRYEIVSYSAERATVRLWTITVASGSKRPVAESVWGTSIAELEWTGDDWRLVGSEDKTGPAPVAMQPEDGEAVKALMEELIEFTEGPRP